MSVTIKSQCRLCLDCDSPKINVLNDVPNDIHIPSVIYELFSFWIKASDSHSKDICLDCVKMVRDFYFFTLKVRESQKILVENINNSSNTGEVKIEYDYVADMQTLNTLTEDVAVKQEFFTSSVGDQATYDMVQNEDPLTSGALKHHIKIKESGHKKSKSKKSHKTSKDKYLNLHSNDDSFSNYEQSYDGASDDSACMPELESEAHPASEVIPKEIYKDGQLTISKGMLNRLISNFYNIVCEICENKPKFPKYLDLFEHCKIKHETRGFLVCCNCKMTERKRIVAHMICHMQPDAFQCRICRTNFSSPSALTTHMKHSHIPHSQKHHLCDQCDKRYASAGKLNQHKLISHAPHDEARRLECSECGKVFYSQAALKQHMSSLHSGKQFLCPVCGKTLQSKCNLKVHMNVHDPSGSNSVQCQECGVIVKSKESLRVHMRLQHSGTLLRCTLCDYTNKASSALKRHMITKHSDEKPFVCEVCHKGFKFKANLRHHSVQHTGEQKYACTFCPRTFAQSGNCYTHRIRMHPEQYKSVRSKKQNSLNKTSKVTTQDA